MDVELFCRATGADKATAERLLSAHHGDLNKAFDAYYHNNSNNNTTNATNSSSNNTSGSNGGPRVMTLDDLKRREAGGDDKTKGKQTFFAGGQRSAMYVEGNDDDGDGDETRNAVESVFAMAKEQQQQKHDNTFTGRAHKLTDEPNNHDTQNTPTKRDDDDDEVEKRVVIFWQDGLTIEHGPLRPFHDPSTQRLLQQLKDQQVPLRDFDIKPNQLVDIKVVHCLDCQFSEDERRMRIAEISGSGEAKDGKNCEKPAFTGSARKLTDDPQPQSTTVIPGQRLDFNPNAPSTRLQLRLANGQRIVEQVNTSVTVGQLQRHMQALNPLNYTGVMMAGMPPSVVTAGPEATLEEAGLLNAVIIQK